MRPISVREREQGWANLDRPGRDLDRHQLTVMIYWYT